MNEEGAHILVGIVSRRLGESCSQQDFAVFTSVSGLLPWIESSIKDNGGMASCTFNLSALPTLGILPSIHVRINFSQSILNHKNKTKTNIVQENRWSLPLRLDSSFLAVNQQKDNSPPSRPLGLKTAQFLRFLRLDIVLDPSSSPPILRSWLYVGGGGRENQTLQIASHST